MSKLGQELEKLAEAVEKKVEPVIGPAIKEVEKFGLTVIEGVVTNEVLKAFDPGTTPPAQSVPAPVEKNISAPGVGPETASPAAPHARQGIGLGSTGAAVRELQRDLGVTVDGIDGPQTTAALKTFQRAHGLEPDGVAGPKTMPALRAEPSLHEGSQGDAVRRVQGELGVRVDGIDGPQTTAAVKTFQQEHGLRVDGIVGVTTWEALDSAAKLAKAYGVPSAAPPAPATIAPPTHAAHVAAPAPGPEPQAPPVAAPHTPPVAGPRTPPFTEPSLPPNTDNSTLGSAGQFLGEMDDLVYRAAFGNDIATVLNPKASGLERTMAGVDLMSNIADPAKGIAEVGVKLGLKLAEKEAAELTLREAALAATRVHQSAAPGTPENAHASSTQSTTEPLSAAMHVRYAGADREITNGFRQSGKILSVEDGIVTQSTGRSTAEYKLSELTAQAREPAAIERMLVPGQNVMISVESNALHVTSLEQQHDRERTRVESR